MDIKKLNEVIQEAKEAKIKPIKAIEPTAEEKAFLDEMSKKIENEEGISYGELAELQSLQPQIIFINDIRLAEWAGIPEEVWNISGIDEAAETVKSEKKTMKEDKYRDAAKEELELFILEEINPIYDTLTKLRSLLRDADEDDIADSLDTVIDFIDKY